MQRLLLLGVLGGLGGCVTHTVMHRDVVATTAKYPISMSDALLSKDGVVTREQMTRHGTFSVTDTSCVEGESALDISGAINEQVEKAGGAGVIGLTVSALQDASCVELEVSGDIVSVKGVP